MKKFENFCSALSNLEDIYKYEEPYDNVILTGLVSLYAICFEQAWKAMKEVLEDAGFAEERTGSPKSIIKTAYAARMIQEEDIWLSALICRNNVAHSYNKEIALDIIRKTKEQFVRMFQELKKTMEQD